MSNSDLLKHWDDTYKFIKEAKYVCMCICVCVSMSMCLSVCTCIHASTYVCVCSSECSSEGYIDDLINKLLTCQPLQYVMQCESCGHSLIA